MGLGGAGGVSTSAAFVPLSPIDPLDVGHTQAGTGVQSDLQRVDKLAQGYRVISKGLTSKG